MNKHKLKKVRKKNLFLARKLTRIKNIKKQAEMLAYERACEKKGRDFSAENLIGEKLTAAREGGWHIDIWKEYRQRKLKNDSPWKPASFVSVLHKELMQSCLSPPAVIMVGKISEQLVDNVNISSTILLSTVHYISFYRLYWLIA